MPLLLIMGLGAQLTLWDDEFVAADCPTLVIHGESDVLVDPSGGKATAEAIPGAELFTVAGMGHNIPPEIFSDLAERISTHAHHNNRVS